MPDKTWLERSRCPSAYEQLDFQRERVHIPKFDCREAFEIGTVARNLAKEEFPGIPVVVDISLPNGYCLSRIVTDVGSSLDDDNWIKRNREMAMRFGCSSFVAGHRFKERLIVSEGVYYGPYPEKYQYLDGGALPIFMDSCEFPVACLTISGLEQYENHWLAVESVSDYTMKVNDSAGRYTASSATDEHMLDCAICLSRVQIGRQSRVTPMQSCFPRSVFQYLDSL